MAERGFKIIPQTEEKKPIDINDVTKKAIDAAGKRTGKNLLAERSKKYEAAHKIEAKKFKEKQKKVAEEEDKKIKDVRDRIKSSARQKEVDSWEEIQETGPKDAVADAVPDWTPGESVERINAKADAKDSRARIKEQAFDNFEIPADYGLKSAREKEKMDKEVEDIAENPYTPSREVKSSSHVKEVRGEFIVDAKIQKMMEHGEEVSQRLGEIGGQLKDLGYDVDAQPIKPSFWGILSKKGRLIAEFMKLSANDDLRYWQEHQHPISAHRALERKAGSVVGLKNVVERENAVTRAQRDKQQINEEKDMASGHASEKIKLKEGKKAETALRQIEEQLKEYGLGPDDMLKPIDSKTRKMVKKAFGVDLKDLKEEYLGYVKYLKYERK